MRKPIFKDEENKKLLNYLLSSSEIDLTSFLLGYEGFLSVRKEDSDYNKPFLAGEGKVMKCPESLMPYIQALLRDVDSRSVERSIIEIQLLRLIYAIFGPRTADYDKLRLRTYVNELQRRIKNNDRMLTYYRDKHIKSKEQTRKLKSKIKNLEAVNKQQSKIIEGMINSKEPISSK